MYSIRTQQSQAVTCCVVKSCTLTLAYFLQQDAGIAGLNSKTHMKILLKWMTGRNIVKLTSVHVGNAKKFLYSPFTESSAEALSAAAADTNNKASAQGGRGKAARGQPKKQAAAALQ